VGHARGWCAHGEVPRCERFAAALRRCRPAGERHRP
jgi:hypothetical protein